MAIAGNIAALTIEVSTVDELLAAIGPGREIILADGVYDLSAAADKPGPHIRWEKVFDGSELIITDVEDLIIKSDGESEIVTTPRYAYVLSFQNVKGIIIENITFGHTEAGECSGGVLRLKDSDTIEIRFSTLYGSGVVGIDAENCEDILIVDSEITGCSYGAMFLSNCSGVYITNSLFSDNEGHPLFLVEHCESVEFEDCVVSSNRGSAVFSGSGRAAFVGGSFVDNDFEIFSDGEGFPETAGVSFEGNGFPIPGAPGETTEVVVEFAGAAFQVPEGWEHELHHDNPGSATFESPDGNAFGFFLPLNKKADTRDARAFAAAKGELEKQLRDNVQIRLSLKAQGNPYLGGEIRRQDLGAVHTERGVVINVRAQILIIHDFYYALCLFWRGEEDEYEDAAYYIFESVTLLESVG
jgi:hypothetical protein